MLHLLSTILSTIFMPFQSITGLLFLSLAKCSKLFHTGLMKKFFIFLLLVSCARSNFKTEPTTVSKATSKTSNGPPEKTLVFIQGYHLDEKSWNAVISKIPSEQFFTRTLGRAGREEGKAATLKNVAKKGCQEISANSILVAHSYGGAIANQMFGYCPQKILKIIYISAIVPFDDEKPFARMTNETEQASYAQAVTFDQNFITPKDPKIFYNVMDSEVDTSKTDLPKTYAESTGLTSDELIFNSDKFKLLPKSYIITTKDSVVSKNTQQMFIKDSEINNVEKISTGHFPMISRPEELAELILKFALES
jgi:pimeloyl-ACP methyl ester carboxylesterase